MICYYWIMKEIMWTNRARKQLKRIPKQYIGAIAESVKKLETFPHYKNLDIKTLQNHRYEYRLRVGRYRVFFNEELVIISIQEVKKRDERTY